VRLEGEDGKQSIGIVPFVRDDALGRALIKEFGCCRDVTDIAGRSAEQAYDNMDFDGLATTRRLRISRGLS
jgi:hypothetical protein